MKAERAVSNRPFNRRSRLQRFDASKEEASDAFFRSFRRPEILEEESDALSFLLADENEAIDRIPSRGESAPPSFEFQMAMKSLSTFVENEGTTPLR